MNKYLLSCAGDMALALGPIAVAQPLVNLGLVGVGRLPADSFDALGPNVDTLGGFFSGMWLDPATIVHSNGSIHVTIYGLPDRGFGDGLQDFHPRVQRLAVTITPYYGPGPVAQNQITIVNTATLQRAGRTDPAQKPWAFPYSIPTHPTLSGAHCG